LGRSLLAVEITVSAENSGSRCDLAQTIFDSLSLPRPAAILVISLAVLTVQRCKPPESDSLGLFFACAASGKWLPEEDATGPGPVHSAVSRYFDRGRIKEGRLKASVSAVEQCSLTAGRSRI
jgi:hypothetical protein